MTRREASIVCVGDVRLPLENFAVARTGILGITRSGKTYTAKGLAEQLLEHDVPIVVFDAIGVWRHMKRPGNGRGAKGFPIVVAGGAEPDLPLTPQSAPSIVRAAIRENIPLVIDLYDPTLSKKDWRQIVQSSFRVLLYENKGLRHVFLEEAAEYAPQKIYDGETYAEVEKLARMGGNVGLGITFINQRAQELNKAVLELCDNLVLLRQRGSHAIDALEKWLDRTSPDIAREIGRSLPHMTQGDCWVWAEDSERPVRTRSQMLRSLHPDRRSSTQEIAACKAVDTGAFVQRMKGELTELIERAKADDPRELRRRIAELERQVAAKPTAAVEQVEVPILPPEQLSAWRATMKDLIDIADRLASGVQEIRSEGARVASALEKVAQPNLRVQRATICNVPQRAETRKAVASMVEHVGRTTDYRERVLATIATLTSRGIPVNQRTVAAWLRVHRNNGSLCGALAALRADGIMSGWTVASAGARAPSIRAGIDGAYDVLESYERTVLDAILRVTPQSQAQLAEALGVHRNNGSLCGALAQLRKMGLLSARGLDVTGALVKGG